MTTKISKSQFKGLLRECLLELIEEGVFDKKLQQIVEAKEMTGGVSSNGTVASSILREQSIRNNNITQPSSAKTGENINPALLAAVDNIANSMTSENKNIFKNIMLETAMTTLQRQLANETQVPSGGALGLLNSGPSTPEAIIADKKQLSSLAGGDISRWAKTAFGKSPNKSQKK